MKKAFVCFLGIFICSNMFAFVLPEGTDARINDIVMNDDGIVSKVYLSEPIEINTPVGKIEATGEILFSEEGKVTEFTPNKNGEIQTPIGIINYASGYRIKFYESGCISTITLSKETELTINGTAFLCKPSFMFLYEDWKPGAFSVIKATPITLKCGNVICEKGSLVSFYDSGNILSLELAEPAEVNTVDGELKIIGSLYLSDEGTPLLATALSSSGLNSKYGKLYPVERTQISFHMNGKVETIVPQDITVIQYEGSTFMALAKNTLGFDDEGIINSATIKGNKFKYHNWTIKTVEDTMKLVIYPNKKIYFPYLYLESINENNSFDTYNKKMRRVLLDENNCFYWQRDLDYEREQNGPKSWNYNYYYCTTVKKQMLDNSVITAIQIKEATPSHFTEKGKFDYEHCPLLFNENNELIGYRKSATKWTKWDDEQDREVDLAKYNRYTDEYENYVEDVIIESQK